MIASPPLLGSLLSFWFGQLASAAASEHALPPTAPAPSPPSATPDPKASPASPRKRKNKKKQLAAEGGLGRFALSGRAFVELRVAAANRQRADSDGVVTTSREPVADVWLGATRLRFDWQSTAPWLSGRSSVDFNTSRVATKDVFLEATGDCAPARAGQFKLPTTPFDTASAGSLPLGTHDESSNTVSEVLFWDRGRPVRGSLQGELVRAADNTPQAYVASGSRGRAQLLLQVGAAF